MQFGETGSGLGKKGKMLFALDIVTDSQRVARLEEYLDLTYTKLSPRVTDLPYVEQLQEVAR
jgi:hypothetical protein